MFEEQLCLPVVVVVVAEVDEIGEQSQAQVQVGLLHVTKRPDHTPTLGGTENTNGTYTIKIALLTY